MKKIYSIRSLLCIILVLITQVIYAKEIVGKKYYLMGKQAFQQGKLEEAYGIFGKAINDVNLPKANENTEKNKMERNEELYIMSDSFEYREMIRDELLNYNKVFLEANEYYVHKDFNKVIDLANTIIKNAEQEISENKELDLIESLAYEKSQQYLCNIYKNRRNYENALDSMGGLSETENWASYMVGEIFYLQGKMSLSLHSLLYTTGGTNYNDYKYVELSRLLSYIILSKITEKGLAREDKEALIDRLEEKNMKDSWTYPVYTYLQGQTNLTDILQSKYDIIEVLKPYGGVGDHSQKELPWIYNIIRYYEGKAGLKEVLSRATNKEKQCTTCYFIGEKYLIDGQQEKAEEYFHKAIATDAWDAPGYDLTREELELKK